MRRIIAGGLLFAMTSSPAFAQRLGPPPADTFTAEQRAAMEEFQKQRGVGISGPFEPMLWSPEAMIRAASMGTYLRYKSVFPPNLSEFIILVTARSWSQQYEWSTHYPIALKAGVSKAIADAIADGRRPQGMSADEEMTHDFCTELLRNHSVSDPTYARVVKRFGEQGAIEMVGVVAYYTFQSMVLNTARTPVPPGAPALKPFPK